MRYNVFDLSRDQRVKFQATVSQIGYKNNNTNITLNIESITINTLKSVKLLGITIDNKINFEELK